MAFRGETVRDEVFSSSNFGDTFRNVFRLGGGWGNVSGPGIFMLRTFISGTMSAVALGLVSAFPASFLYGTAALPFLVGSCLGFVCGAIGFYRDALRKSLISLEAYPMLLRLHLHANFPSEGFNRWNPERLRSAAFSRSWTLQSMLIASWLTATPALDRIMELDEEALITEGVQKTE